MKYAISENQLTVTNTPRIPGKPGATGIVFSNENGTNGVTIRRDRIRVEVARQDEQQVLDIPDDVDQTELERLMDDILLFNEDMTEDEHNQKWQIGDYAPEPS